MGEDLMHLVIQLKSLCLKETQILEQLDRTRAQETQVIQQIKSAWEHRHSVEVVDCNTFEEMDGMRITNKVQRRVGCPPATEADRRGMVTSYDQELDKVYFTTNSGFRMWRLLTNLIHIE